MLGVLLASCGPAPRDWIGEWTGELPLSSTDGPNDTVAKTLRLVRLTVKADDTFVLVRGGIPAEGDAIRDGDRLVLKFRKILGQPMEKQPPEVQKQYADARVEVDKDGTVKLVDPSDFNRDPVKLLHAKPSGD